MNVGTFHYDHGYNSRQWTRKSNARDLNFPPVLWVTLHIQIPRAGANESTRLRGVEAPGQHLVCKHTDLKGSMS